jgi:hypothetical protein
MKKRLSLLLTIALAAGISGNAQAYQSYNETYQIMGCRSYMENPIQNRGWLVGYLTAIEMQRGTTYLQGANLQRVYNLFERYCRANPRRNMDEAADAVFAGLGR